MEGKLAPPPKFYSGPLFRNTCDLICPLGKAILLRQMDEISPHVSGLCGDHLGAALRDIKVDISAADHSPVAENRIWRPCRKVAPSRD